MATPVQINIYDLRKALRFDPELFIQFFLEDSIEYDVPRFHVDIFGLMVHTDVERFACAIPRAHAKTTLAKLAAVWYFLHSDFRFILYMSNTFKIALPAVVDIISFMESQNFRAVYGDLQWHIRQEGTGIYKFTLNDKVCILRAHGAGQQVRGINVDNERPQLAIIDDLEDNDNIATLPLFTKLKRWVFGPFLKALDPKRNKLIWLGNMISQQSMLFENCGDETWFSRRYGCLLQDGTSLWPDLWPLEKLKADFIYYQKRGMSDIWFAEMMNLPSAGGAGLITADEVYYKPAILPEDAEMAFITVDLAISKNEWAHKTVATVHAYNGECWQIVEVLGQKGMDPVYLFDVLIDMAFRWRVAAVGIENVAFQASLQYIYPHFCRERGIEGITFVPLSAGNQRKAFRIVPWVAMIKRKEYALTEGDFAITEELLSFNPTKDENTDDHIDSCAYGVQMIYEYTEEIMASKDIVQINSTQSTYELSEV